jgi:hypothetical protein
MPLCADDDRQEAPTLIVSFHFFWTSPICRRKIVPLIIPVHTLSRQSFPMKKNLCSLPEIPPLSAIFGNRGLTCAAPHTSQLMRGRVCDGQQDYQPWACDQFLPK